MPWNVGTMALWNHERKTTDVVAVRAGRAGGVRGLDGDTRRSVFRSARLLPQEEQQLPHARGAEILLSVHVRVLLQPLCGGCGGVDDRLSAAGARLARRTAWLVYAGVDSQRVYEPVR